MTSKERKVVLLLNDQGGVVLQIEEGLISPTIRAQMGGHPPIVMLEVTDDEKPRATSD